MCCISSHTSQDCLWQKVLSFCLVSRGQLILPCRRVLAAICSPSVKAESQHLLEIPASPPYLLFTVCHVWGCSPPLYNWILLCNFLPLQPLFCMSFVKKCKRIYCLESTREKWDVLSHSVFLGSSLAGYTGGICGKRASSVVLKK